ncbi:hypothetical protein G4B88_029107 [Cannabis sativa]|uniref:RNase H type-1 domain-containing protein n=1 Tax=Cannabis sativa TaxID=3483 RepID=A0A7J6GQ65_CANSA|nr:hypothetical protein G4B88_029107 [Cannabis sativa]
MLSPEKSLPEGLLEKPANAMDELLSQMNKLTLLDEDGWEINEDGDAEVGKLVWGLLEKDRGVEIKHHSRNSIFLVFSFKSSKDLNRILLKNPWFLTNGTLILDRMNGIPSNWENFLSKIQLSGRILSLPPKSITQKNLERLAGMAKDIIEVQKADVAKISSKGLFTFKGYGTWLKLDEKKDILDIFWKGKIGSYLNHYSGNSFCQNNFNSPPARVNLGTGSVNLKNSDILSNANKAVASNVPVSCVEDMELIVNHDTSSMGKSLGWEEGQINCDTHLIERERVLNVKRNGDWREELKEKTPSIFKSPDTFNPRLVSSIQKACNPAPFQLFEVPVEYENTINNSCIGDGKTKRRKITPRRPKSGGNVTVKTLKNANGGWKVEEINCWFHKEDIPWVLGITPSRERNDTIGWTLTTNGQYTVASGYKLRFRDPNIAECSDNSASRTWWKVVWGSRLTPKMKIFIWRVFHHWIPVKTKLVKRGASLIEGQSGCGLRVIIRDHLGALVAAATDFIPGCLSVLLAETLAIRLALKLVETRLMQTIYIASDSQLVIKALKGKTRINTDWGIVIDDCILASKRFYNLSFNFSPRKCNTVAHCLANWSRLYHVTGVWTSTIPDCAAAYLKADMPLGASL